MGQVKRRNAGFRAERIVYDLVQRSGCHDDDQNPEAAKRYGDEGAVPQHEAQAQGARPAWHGRFSRAQFHITHYSPLRTCSVQRSIGAAERPLLHPVTP